ncbi:MAG: VRR-NUC domain-containing protein [Anaerovoracaceae bacterium]
MSRHLESAEQRALFDWANLNLGKHPELAFMFHVPNGGKRDAKAGAAMKREGVKPGVPDICLPVPMCREKLSCYHGLYIEMKVGKNKLCDSQKAFVDHLVRNGYAVAVCYSWTAAKDCILAYLESRDEEELHKFIIAAY